MATFSDLPLKAQLGIVLGLAVAVTAGLYYFVYKSLDDQNRVNQAELTKKLAENAELRKYEGKKIEVEQRIANLKQQLDTLNRIVPSEKEAPQFMEMMQAEAAGAGIEIRRYTSRPVSTREFFAEVPFEMDVDGPYFSVLNFFERVAKLERIINISGLKMSTIQRPSDAGVRRSYPYAPSETVAASCVATTFFSRESTATPAAAPAAKK